MSLFFFFLLKTINPSSAINQLSFALPLTIHKHVHMSLYISWILQDQISLQWYERGLWNWPILGSAPTGLILARSPESWSQPNFHQNQSDRDQFGLNWLMRQAAAFLPQWQLFHSHFGADSSPKRVGLDQNLIEASILCLFFILFGFHFSSVGLGNFFIQIRNIIGPHRSGGRFRFCLPWIWLCNWLPSVHVSLVLQHQISLQCFSVQIYYLLEYYIIFSSWILHA